MTWYKEDISKLAALNFKNLSEEDKVAKAFDLKYGNFDYSKDARLICEKEFAEIFNKIKDKLINKNTLLTGANSGYEIKYLQTTEITVLDISKIALQKLSLNYSWPKIIYGNVNSLPFKDKEFDSYLGFRVLNSWNVNLTDALNESIRITKDNALIIISIPNGYLIKNKLVKGIYDINKNRFDTKLPYIFSDYIKTFFLKKNLHVELFEIPSEIIIKATKV